MKKHREAEEKVGTVIRNAAIWEGQITILA
jgi:hypothetical protein